MCIALQCRVLRKAVGAKVLHVQTSMIQVMFIMALFLLLRVPCVFSDSGRRSAWGVFCWGNLAQEVVDVMCVIGLFHVLYLIPGSAVRLAARRLVYFCSTEYCNYLLHCFLSAIRVRGFKVIALVVLYLFSTYEQ